MYPFDILAFLETIKMLKELPIPVYCYFEKENIHTADENSTLMLTLISSISQEEVNSTSKSVQWGVQRLARRGIIRRPSKTFGYNVDKNCKWTINEDEAKIYRRICKEYINGKSINLIIKELYEDGIKSPTGKEFWSINSIKLMLTNEIYKGDFRFQKTYHADAIEKKIKKNTGELPQYLIEKHHEPIVDSYTWDQIQKEFKNRSRGSGREISKNAVVGNKLFYRKFICKECKGLIGCFQDYKTKLVYWRCNNTVHKRKGLYCSSFYIKEDYIAYNFNSLLLQIKSNTQFKQEAEKIISEISPNESDMLNEEKIRIKIEDLNQQLYEIVDEELNKNGRDTKKVDLLTSEIVKLQKQQKELISRGEMATRYRNEFEWFLNKLIKLDYISPTTELNKLSEEIFERIVKRGVIDKQGMIKYEFTFGVEWQIEMVYHDYQIMMPGIKAETKLNELINSEDTKRLLDFCKEPKRPSEMQKFMDVKSAYIFRIKILHPLLDYGLLMYTNPGSKNGKYYSVK